MTEKRLTLKDLKQDPNNARQHNERNITMIADGMQEIGAARSIVIDEKNTILCGNGAAEAAAQAGISKVIIVEATGDELIAVRRTGLTPKQKKRLALFDNRTQETSNWDTDVIKSIAEDDEDALRGLWSKEEIDALVSLPSLDPLEKDESDQPTRDVTDDGMQRMTLWIPREEYDAFMTNIRMLSGSLDIDDVGRVLVYAAEQAVQKAR